MPFNGAVVVREVRGTDGGRVRYVEDGPRMPVLLLFERAQEAVHGQARA
jgi:hypothetical protein